MEDQEDFSTTNTFSPKDSIIVHTYHPEGEIWHYISKLSGYNYVFNLLKDRVKNDFFGLDIDLLTKTKKDYIEKIRRDLRKQKEEEKTDRPKVNKDNDKQLEEEDNIDVEIHEPLCRSEEIDKNAREIIHTIKQAIEIYRASQTVSLYAKPILLYYSYARLARVLYLSTYKKDESEGKTHGLEMRDADIICLRSGAFSRFHDSYSSKPSIYLDNYAFKWQDLLEQPTDRFRLFEIMLRGNSIIDLKVKGQSSAYSAHELTREIIFTYAMSMLARYRVVLWNDIIEGRYVNKDILWKINDYLRQTQSFFPNLVFNKLHELEYHFYPEPRMGSYYEYHPSVSSDHE
jgi:hypothetical protein